jgi:hypothetical protein
MPICQPANLLASSGRAAALTSCLYPELPSPLSMGAPSLPLLSVVEGSAFLYRGKGGRPRTLFACLLWTVTSSTLRKEREEWALTFVVIDPAQNDRPTKDLSS